jgi:DNA-binding CsgD family transcriptional regulator
MVRQIHDYMISVQSEIRDINASQPQDCNFQIMIEAVPADPPTLPMPQLYVVNRDRAEEVAARSASTGMHELSPRERQVAAMLAAGKTRPEIAEALGVSLNTVATIGKRIYAKLGVRRRAELASRLRLS